MSNNGAWSVTIPAYNWTFAGSLGGTALAPHVDSGTDNVGPYQEIAFAYNISGTPRAGAIRLYPSRPVVMFFSIYNAASKNAAPFPTISSYPSLYRMSFSGEFANYDFVNLNSDSPWAFFDTAYNTFILSPAANYMTASNNVADNGSITAGINSDIASLPAGFTHATALVFGNGINSTFGTWGQMMTDLTQKKRPTNDADALMKYISYWTDNGATYYYNTGGSIMNTLDSVKGEFDTIGVKLGSLQLDSWWYPKGPDNSWSSHMGIWTYTAAPDLFQPDLATFQKGLGVPLTTHARWIDANSPYRSQYTISGNVATDPKYWEDIGTYIKSAGTIVYEQDWLGENAHTDLNLTDPYLFLGNMAASMASRGINIQYCMAEPKHFLQSTVYNNVTNIRTSNDRFGSNRWTPYFYSNRLAASIGLWPFSDTFMSSETNNMIAALLAGGPVGVGDSVGALSRTNILRAARGDGTIVKPDVPATPLDSVFIADAQGLDSPMIAAASTDFGKGMKANYIFAYPRLTNNTVTIDPAVYGIAGASVVYDYLEASATFIPQGQTQTLNVIKAAAYYVLVPVGTSGIGFLGDKGQYITLGRQRVSEVSDAGVLGATISFAPGEKLRTIFGYAPQAIEVSSIAGGHHGVMWNSTSGIFSVTVTPNSKGIARVQISLGGSKPTPAPGPTGSGISASIDNR